MGAIITALTVWHLVNLPIKGPWVQKPSHVGNRRLAGAHTHPTTPQQSRVTRTAAPPPPEGPLRPPGGASLPPDSLDPTREPGPTPALALAHPRAPLQRRHVPALTWIFFIQGYTTGSLPFRPGGLLSAKSSGHAGALPPAGAPGVAGAASQCRGGAAGAARCCGGGGGGGCGGCRPGCRTWLARRPCAPGPLACAGGCSGCGGGGRPGLALPR